MIRFAARPLRALAAAALIGGTTILTPPSTFAADVGLQLVTRTSYAAIPVEKRVHVTVDATAKDVKPDPPNGRYYYTDARFAVQPGIQNLTATAGGSTLVARIVSATQEFTTIDVAFGHGVFYNETFAFQVSFDIVDPGGVPQRDVRIASSLVAFPVWAFGSEQTPGSNVRVIIPAEYTVSVIAGSLTVTHQPNGTTLLAAGAISDPTQFFAYITAERPGAFRQTHASIALPERTVYVDVRAWADDAAWGDHEEALIAKGLPVLLELIGLPYLVRGDLTIEEAAVANLGDYAGVYDPTAEMMRVRYDADDYVTLHEAAHTWFNNNLFSDRWIGEAWAEYYGVQAGRRIGATGQVFTLTSQLKASKIQLNAWGAIGTETSATEDYAYAATYELANLIAARASLDGLRAVWQAAHAGEESYQPPRAAKPEIGSAVTVDGWQRLLDLLEERTHKDYDDLWREWVVTPDQADLMTSRAAARTQYAQTLTLAGMWQLPYQVRYELGAWQFDAADGLMADAREVLASRDEIAREASAQQLHVPGTLQHAFEGANSMDVPKRVAREELAALSALDDASSAVERTTSATEWVGLLFADPRVELSAARHAFETGDATGAIRDAKAAQAERDRAVDDGRLRIGAAGGVLLALDGGAMLLIYRRRRARVPRHGISERLPDAAPEAMPETRSADTETPLA